MSGAGVAAGFQMVAALACVAGCTSTPDDLTGQLWLESGQETDTWTASPVPATVQVDLVGKMRTRLAEVAAPTSAVDLGTGTPAETIAAFEATGYDADGNAVVHGSSVTYSVTTFANSAPVAFVGRTGGLSRAPGALLFEHRHPLLEVVGHAYVLIAGGDLSTTTQNPLDLYDAANWVVAPRQTFLTQLPRSWAVFGAHLLVLNDSGASIIDLSSGSTTAATPPAGLAFADVVGGQTIVAADDTRYIIGGTRASGDPTDSVLRVAPDGTLSALTLSAPRLGAAAGIVNEQLVVTGGSDSADGVEVLNAAGTAFSALTYPADAVQGAALVQLDATTALLAGGTDANGASGALRTVDLACSKHCATAALPGLDFSLANARGYNLSAGSVVLSGDSSDGETHLFTLTQTPDFALTELPRRTPRSAASLVAFPNGQFGLIGGDALADGSPAASVELYFPPVSP